MSNKNSSRATRRRRFLKITGSTAVTGLVAGCSGTDDGSDSSNGGDNGDGSDGGDGSSDGGSDGGGDGSDGDDGDIDYPTDDIDFVVPYASGGGFDEYSRLMAPYLEEELGTTVNVRNVTGGGGVVGATQVYNAEPDGHTMTIWDTLDGTFPMIGRDVDYDLTEMSHVGYLTQAPNAITLSSDLDIQTWDEFVDAISEINFATQGRGAVSHVGMALLGGITGEFSVDDVNYVHYGGTGEALSGLERGEASGFMVGTATSAVKVVQALDAEMFMIFSAPEVLKDYTDENDIDVKNWAGELDVNGLDEFSDLTFFRRFVTGPPGVDDAILERQHEAFRNVINNDEFRTEAREAARPLVNPESGSDPVSAALDNILSTLRQDPYEGIIKDALGD